jgi:hypothetical protein
MKRTFNSFQHMLSNEIVEDMHPEDVYKLAKEYAKTEFGLIPSEELYELYGEKYEYVFREYGLVPDMM